MTSAFSTRHVEAVRLDGMTPEQFMETAAKAINKLHWRTGTVTASGLTAYTRVSMKSWGEEFRLDIREGTVILTSASIGGQLMDWGRNKKNIREFLDAFTESSAIEKTSSDEETEAPADEQVCIEPTDLPVSVLSGKTSWKGIISLFLPTRSFLITPLIIDLNILIFLAMALSGINILMPDPESIIHWGANCRPYTLSGQWWRLITNCFLHYGIIHLLMNMYALWSIGILLEPQLGKLRFASTYVLTGFAASLTSLGWHELSISVGASGAIFGMYGLFLALLTTKLFEKSARISLLISIGVFVMYNLLMGMKPGIDNAAHIGGLLSGIIVGYSLYPSLLKKNDKNLIFRSLGILTAGLAIAIIFFFRTLPNDIPAYEQRMKKFAELESLGLEVYNLSSSTPDDILLNEIRFRGLYYWNENLKLVRSLNELDLPRQLEERNVKLEQYCKLRIRSLQLSSLAIESKSQDYDSEIQNCNQQIEQLINELTAQTKE